MLLTAPNHGRAVGYSVVTLGYASNTACQELSGNNGSFVKEVLMALVVQSQFACSHWVASVKPKTGPEVSVHIHRGAPIEERDALRIARKAAPFGRVANLIPVGPCSPVIDEDY